jgi:hypothetical protein
MEKETKKKTKSLLTPLLNNTFALMAFKSNMPVNEGIVLIATDKFSDLIIRHEKPDLDDLGDLKNVMCQFGRNSDPAADRSLRVEHVILLTSKTMESFEIDKFYALGEFDLLAEDIYLMRGNHGHEKRKL